MCLNYPFSQKGKPYKGLNRNKLAPTYSERPLFAQMRRLTNCPKKAKWPDLIKVGLKSKGSHLFQLMQMVQKANWLEMLKKYLNKGLM